MTRFATVTRLRVSELLRQPLTLALLLVLPPVVIELYGVSVASFPNLPTLGAPPATVGRMTGALFAVAFLAGLVGLFQIVSARRGDERAAIAGIPPRHLLATRLATMALVSIAGAIVALATLDFGVAVEAPALAFAALVLAALIYGLLGALVGTLVPRELEGSLVLVFVADIDNALSSGLFPVEASASVPLLGSLGVTDVAPLYHPHELLTAAVLDGGLATGHLAPALGWLGALLVAAFAAYGHTAGGWHFALGGGS